MRVKITAELPFSWCERCSRIELETEKIYADGKVYEWSHGCRNAETCEALERARQEAKERQRKEGTGDNG